MGQLLSRVCLCTNTNSHSSSATTIDSLPGEILSKILASIPLEELLSRHYRLVCRQWNSTIESLCHRARSLMLWDNDNSDCSAHVSCDANSKHCQRLVDRFFGDLRLSEFVVLPGGQLDDRICFQDCASKGIYWLKPEFCHTLLRLFPHLTQLVVHFGVNIYNVDSLTYLLRHLPQLETLSLWDMATDRNGQKLYDTINNVLTHLVRLEIRDSYFIPDDMRDFQVFDTVSKLRPTLARLRHFATSAIPEDGMAHLGRLLSLPTCSLVRLGIYS